MTVQARRFAAPAFLFLCLLLGGSAQGAWGNAILRLIAIFLIAWSLLQKLGEEIPNRGKLLLWLIFAALGVGVLQLIPLPFAAWSALPGREMIVTGFDLLGLPAVATPLSLAPYDTVATLLALLPPLGMLATLFAFRVTSRRWLAVALVGGTISGVMLGALQVSSADPMTSPWYLYRQSNFGVATGFFANGNHMAALLLATIPFIAAWGASLRESTADLEKRRFVLAAAVGGMLAVALGLMLNGSLAGYGLGIPVLLASLAILVDTKARTLRLAPVALAVTAAIAAVILWTSPPSLQLGGAEASVTTRQEIFQRSAASALEYAPFGSGIGSFEEVYRLGEDPDAVGRFFVNHAHNDYLELAVETGLAGIALIVLFLTWWLGVVRKLLRSPLADRYAMAGAIASATILIHSAVDYPLRTAAISTLFAMCLGVMIMPGRVARREGDLRPARHLVVG